MLDLPDKERVNAETGSGLPRKTFKWATSRPESLYIFKRPEGINIVFADILWLLAK